MAGDTDGAVGRYRGAGGCQQGHARQAGRGQQTYTHGKLLSYAETCVSTNGTCAFTFTAIFATRHPCASERGPDWSVQVSREPGKVPRQRRGAALQCRGRAVTAGAPGSSGCTAGSGVEW
ncbi:hypothetical protein GCM10009601_08690 [Streptomyces thermospinosisporus]|uniref:Uncharacterized protein n=1 Tax=Streptomyces thermospinosisporus TaxID=161482 RepID=A0ABN1YKZ1_9ACTN